MLFKSKKLTQTRKVAKQRLLESLNLNDRSEAKLKQRLNHSLIALVNEATGIRVKQSAFQCFNFQPVVPGKRQSNYAMISLNMLVDKSDIKKVDFLVSELTFRGGTI